MESIDEIVGRVVAILQCQPSGLITDIDGTISRIAMTPEAAVVEPDLLAALELIARHVDVVAVVSGRAAVDAARMVGLPSIVAIGNHGMERLHRGSLTIAKNVLAFEPVIERVLAAVQQQVPDPGVIYENKGATASIHYRAAPDPARAKADILAALAPLLPGSSLRLTEGRMVIELRPPVTLNKGTALRELVADFGLGSVIFLGDDMTDLDAMRALSELRSDGKIKGLSIGVAATESPAALAETADVMVQGVDGVHDLLVRVAVRFEQVAQG